MVKAFKRRLVEITLRSAVQLLECAHELAHLDRLELVLGPARLLILRRDAPRSPVKQRPNREP